MNLNPDGFRIIVIDDNPAIHHDFIKILTKNTSNELKKMTMDIFGEKEDEIVFPEFEIDTASQGQEGVELIKKAKDQGRPYSLAFVDIRMPPGWDGIETIKHIWELDKDIQVVICTAYSDYSWEETISHLGQTDNLLILKKPFDNIAVRQLACALTKKWQLTQETHRYTDTLRQKVEDRTFSLQKSLSLVKATLESSSDGILVVNNEGDVVDYNQKFVSMWKIPVLFMENKETAKIMQYLKSQLQDRDEDFIKTDSPFKDAESVAINIIKLSTGKVFECYAQPHMLNEKNIGYVYDFRDITKRAKLERELQHQATHDSLTGLPNRIMLLERIKAAIKSAEQHNTIFALIFLDLDRFKLINDSLSHAVGDELLQAAAQRLQSVMRSQDTLARLGGDEFVIVLTNLTEENHAITKVKKIISIFQEPFHIDNRAITVPASIGISFYPKDGITGDILLRNADAAMYRAKEEGGNTFQFYSNEMNIQNLAKLDQEMELRRAIVNNEFFLCYQPQVELSSEKIIAVEALIRWQHPQKGVLLPIDFIQLAEATGLIVPIGEWVMRTACQQNKKWQDDGLPPIRVAVNLTAQQFKQQGLIQMVKNVLNESNLDPAYLELELTENVIISNIDIINAITELKKLGVAIAIDDFGTGYSSLSYLKKIPLDRLKIDGSFIQHIKLAGDDEVIIRAVIAMAKNLNLEVLAEGVETQEQLDFLKKHECGEVQGYFYSKPLSSIDLEAYLRDPSHIKEMIKLSS